MPTQSTSMTAAPRQEDVDLEGSARTQSNQVGLSFKMAQDKVKAAREKFPSPLADRLENIAADQAVTEKLARLREIRCRFRSFVESAISDALTKEEIAQQSQSIGETIYRTMLEVTSGWDMRDAVIPQNAGLRLTSQTLELVCRLPADLDRDGTKTEFLETAQYVDGRIEAALALIRNQYLLVANDALEGRKQMGKIKRAVIAFVQNVLDCHKRDDLEKIVNQADDAQATLALERIRSERAYARTAVLAGIFPVLPPEGHAEDDLFQNWHDVCDEARKIRKAIGLVAPGANHSVILANNQVRRMVERDTSIDMQIQAEARRRSTTKHDAA